MRRVVKIKNKLVFSIVCVLTLLITCFGLISILTAKNSFSSTDDKWDGATIASFFSLGNGTSENPYLISNGEELAYFKQIIENNNDTYGDKYYALTSDIDLGNNEWIAIGIDDNLFRGYFDGRGYTISNFKIVNPQEFDDYNYYGFFSIIDNASINNLNFANAIVMPNTSLNLVKVSVVVCDVIKGNIGNISVLGSKIDLNNTVENVANMIGGISSYIGEDSTFSGIYADISFESSYSTSIGSISNTILSDSSYIIDNVNTNSILFNERSIYIKNEGELTNYFKALNDGYFVDDKVISVNEVIDLLNKNLDSSEYCWQFNEGMKITSLVASDDSYVAVKSFSFSINKPIILHDSGIDGDTVYINDLDSDYNYYMGLNYTDFSDTGTLPTGVSKNTYNDANLVKVYTRYDGSSVYDSNLVGYVSLEEQYSSFVYYKYYPVVSGYVTFELIDNPFADRPDDMVFNGWYTNYDGAIVYLDKDTYTRYVKIPVNDIDENISITFYANWIKGNIYSIDSNVSWSNILGNFDDFGFHEIAPIPVYNNPGNLYVSGTVSNRSYYPSGAVNNRGQSIAGNYCNTWYGSCTYYIKVDGTNLNPNNQYYQLNRNQMVSYTPTISGYVDNDMLTNGSPLGGFYEKVNISRGNSLATYYDDSVNYYTSGVCNTSTGCTMYKLISFYDNDGNILTYDGNGTYYYLATRDTNIAVLKTNISATLNNDKPFTLTGIHNGSDYRSSGSYNISSSYIYASRDLRIEWINLVSNSRPSYDSSNIAGGVNNSAYIYGNWNNLKIGRGLVISTNVSSKGILGGGNTSTGSTSSVTKYRLIVESGYYNVLSVTDGTIGSYSSGGWGGSSGARDYINGTAIYGSDLDRISNNNLSLNIYFCASGSWGGDIYADNERTGIAINTIIKSGSFGTSKYDYSTGVYVGGRAGGTHYAARMSVIEGGYIYNLIGGPLTNSNRAELNDTYINIKGGSIDYVIGGAGASATYGNRIINHTGGTVNYSIFGGSNGYTGSDSGSYQGTLDGNTFIYVGGNAIVGSDDAVNNNLTIFGAEAGSVFGIGNGNSNSSKIGTANSSNIIIDSSATIKRNVYGGGNYGAVGINATSSTTSIKLLNGTVYGSIYGGGNNNGSGATNVKSNISITMDDGLVMGSVYGGSRTKGIVYGSVNVSILGGVINNDVYGGGEGGYSTSTNYGTYITDNVSVLIGKDGKALNIKGNVYGGSAFGSVNGTTSTTQYDSSLSTSVTVNNGIIVGSVFGGGKGNSTFTPNVFGNVVVTVNNGNIGSVYGGNDESGSPSGGDSVYLNGGTIGNCYGGGNNTGQSGTNIYLRGSEVTNLYGGSNSSGAVNLAKVFITSGLVNGNVYGGNNIGGMTVDSNVLISGGEFKGDIYGGGSLADTTTSSIDISSVLANDVYGGGEQASVSSTDIKVTDATLKNVFGGSNISGNVDYSNILINSGSIDNLYGGNNQGGITNTPTITINDGVVGNCYGGGNNALSVTSTLHIYGGTITNLYGGGNEAGVTDSKVNIYGGTIGNTYGGSNVLGDVDNSLVFVGNKPITTDLISVDINAVPAKAESWQSTEFSTYVPITITVNNLTDQVIDDWEVILNMPSDAVIFANYSSTEFDIVNGKATINQVNKYTSNVLNSLSANGSYSFDFSILTNVSGTDFNISYTVVKPVSSSTEDSFVKIDNIYGGNNMGGSTNKCVIDIDNGNIGNVYGGGNEAVVNNTYITIDKANIGNVYGGGNAALSRDSTFVDINDSTISGNVYGGGDEGAVLGSCDVYLTNTTVLGSCYAGGNGVTAVVSGDTSITIDGKSVIGTLNSKAPTYGSVFGSGKAAATGDAESGKSSATVNIVGATIYGNVYGGANTSVVYGKTTTNIGSAAVKNDNLIQDDIHIYGTVFGGGEANASGSETYDFEFISVTDAIDIYIDGTGYIENGKQFLLSGSIFGSGNASSSSGVSNILIKNLGEREAPSRNISIQRADNVVLDNSVIELSGTTDRTNDYSTIKYSFNRVDLLTIKNNTVLMLKQNANLLKQLRSMVDIDGKEVISSVVIDDENKTVTKNVDNRIYLSPNHNLNITTNQAATAYGKIVGMTFFGMYNSYDSGTFQYGVYDDDVSYGDSADAGDVIIGGSYILGLHQTNHDIKVNGFYTNYLSDDYSTVTTSYIEPTPPEAGYYMWVIGAQAINYTVDLNASKYSSLGALELSMIDFSDGNTTFNVIGFNSEGLKKGVSLVEPSTVPKVANNPEDANKILGLAIKTETREWTNYGTTKFFTNDNSKYSGDLVYKTDSQKVAPSLMFYLYHAKNITVNEDIGSVVISLQAESPINEIESEVQLITITVNITATDIGDGNYYDASITYDKKYEMPSATSVNITNQSQFTAYYSIFSEVDSFESFYGRNNTNYHALVTNHALPVGTEITMIDIGADSQNASYYYYIVDNDKYNATINQLNSEGEATYLLSDFIKMGSVDEDNTYDDASSNLLYYSSKNKHIMEEFIFIFDFKNTDTVGTNLNNSVLLELRNSDDRSLVTVLGIRQNLMFYNKYDSTNVVLKEDVTTDSNYLYYDIANSFSLKTLVDYDQTDNSEAIINTNYESNSMGLNIMILDGSLNQISSSMLTGTNILIDNVRYFADSDGVFRIKLAGKVSNLNKIIYVTTDKMLPSGNYTMRFTLFASADGKHNSHTLESSYVDIPIVVVGSDNSIVVSSSNEAKLVYGDTGLNQDGLKYNRYTINYNSVLSNSNIRISLYKRSTNDSLTVDYEEVDINSLFTNYFVDPISKGYKAVSSYEKMLNINKTGEVVLDFDLVDAPVSGTYKIVFKLYDGNQLIEDDQEYVIVRKPV